MFRHEVSRKRAEVTKISPGDNQADLVCELKSIDFRHLGQKVTRGAEHTCAVCLLGNISSAANESVARQASDEY